jgi:hypothetical protein
MRSQTKQTLENLIAVLEELGVSREKVAKVNGFMTDFRYLDRFNGVYREFFKPPYPARAILGKGLALEDAMIEVDAIATVSGTRFGHQSCQLGMAHAQAGPRWVMSSSERSSVARCQRAAKWSGRYPSPNEQALAISAQPWGRKFDFPTMNQRNGGMVWFQYLQSNLHEILSRPSRRATIQGNIEQEDPHRIQAWREEGVSHMNQVPGVVTCSEETDTIYLKDLRGSAHSHADASRDLVCAARSVMVLPGRLVGPATSGRRLGKPWRIIASAGPSAVR